MVAALHFGLIACAALASALPSQDLQTRDKLGVIPPHLPPGSFPRPPTKGDPRTSYCTCGKKDGHLADKTTEKACPSISAEYYDAAGDFSNKHFPGCYSSAITFGTVPTFNQVCVSLGAVEGVCCVGAPPPEGGPEGNYECSPSIFDGGSQKTKRDLVLTDRSERE